MKIVVAVAILFLARPVWAQAVPTPEPTIDQQSADDARVRAAELALASAQAAYNAAQEQSQASREAAGRARQYAASLESQRAADEALRAIQLADQALASARGALVSVETLSETFRGSQDEIRRLNTSVNELRIYSAQLEHELKETRAQSEALAAQVKSNVGRPLIPAGTTLIVLGLGLIPILIWLVRRLP